MDPRSVIDYGHQPDMFESYREFSHQQQMYQPQQFGSYENMGQRDGPMMESYPFSGNSLLPQLIQPGEIPRLLSILPMEGRDQPYYNPPALNDFSHTDGGDFSMGNPIQIETSPTAQDPRLRNKQQNEAPIFDGRGFRTHMGIVTQMDTAYGNGMIDKDIFFQTSVVTGKIPLLGERVVVTAEPVTGMPFNWNAKTVRVEAVALKSILKKPNDPASENFLFGPSPLVGIGGNGGILIDPVPPVRRIAPPPPIISLAKGKEIYTPDEPLGSPPRNYSPTSGGVQSLLDINFAPRCAPPRSPESIERTAPARSPERIAPPRSKSSERSPDRIGPRRSKAPERSPQRSSRRRSKSPARSRRRSRTPERSSRRRSRSPEITIISRKGNSSSSKGTDCSSTRERKYERDDLNRKETKARSSTNLDSSTRKSSSGNRSDNNTNEPAKPLLTPKQIIEEQKKKAIEMKVKALHAAGVVDVPETTGKNKGGTSGAAPAAPTAQVIPPPKKVTIKKLISVKDKSYQMCLKMAEKVVESKEKKHEPPVIKPKESGKGQWKPKSKCEANDSKGGKGKAQESEGKSDGKKSKMTSTKTKCSRETDEKRESSGKLNIKLNITKEAEENIRKCEKDDRTTLEINQQKQHYEVEKERQFRYLLEVYKEKNSNEEYLKYEKKLVDLEKQRKKRERRLFHEMSRESCKEFIEKEIKSTSRLRSMTKYSELKRRSSGSPIEIHREKPLERKPEKSKSRRRKESRRESNDDRVRDRSCDRIRHGIESRIVSRDISCERRMSRRSRKRSRDRVRSRSRSRERRRDRSRDRSKRERSRSPGDRRTREKHISQNKRERTRSRDPERSRSLQRISDNDEHVDFRALAQTGLLLPDRLESPIEVEMMKVEQEIRRCFNDVERESYYKYYYSVHKNQLLKIKALELETLKNAKRASGEGKDIFPNVDRVVYDHAAEMPERKVVEYEKPFEATPLIEGEDSLDQLREFRMKERAVATDYASGNLCVTRVFTKQHHPFIFQERREMETLERFDKAFDLPRHVRERSLSLDREIFDYEQDCIGHHVIEYGHGEDALLNTDLHVIPEKTQIVRVVEQSHGLSTEPPSSMPRASLRLVEDLYESKRRIEEAIERKRRTKESEEEKWTKSEQLRKYDMMEEYARTCELELEQKRKALEQQQVELEEKRMAFERERRKYEEAKKSTGLNEKYGQMGLDRNIKEWEFKLSAINESTLEIDYPRGEPFAARRQRRGSRERHWMRNQAYGFAEQLKDSYSRKTAEEWRKEDEMDEDVRMEEDTREEEQDIVDEDVIECNERYSICPFQQDPSTISQRHRNFYKTIEFKVKMANEQKKNLLFIANYACEEYVDYFIFPSMFDERDPPVKVRRWEARPQMTKIHQLPPELLSW